MYYLNIFRFALESSEKLMNKNASAIYRKVTRQDKKIQQLPQENCGQSKKQDLYRNMERTEEVSRKSETHLNQTTTHNCKELPTLRCQRARRSANV